MQGTKKMEPAGRVLDLDAQLAGRMLEPVPVLLGGHVYQVRTDLTATEVAECVKQFNAAEDVAGFTILLGDADEAAKLDAFLTALPKQHLRPVSRAIMCASVVLAEYTKPGDDDLDLGPAASQDAAGESSAS